MQLDEQLSKPQEKPGLGLLNKEEWQAHVNAWQASGLSQKVFCEQHGLSFNSFSYMRSKLLAKDKPLAAAGFAPVKLIKGTRDQQKQLTLENRLGIKLHLPLHLADHELIRLLRLLGW